MSRLNKRSKLIQCSYCFLILNSNEELTIHQDNHVNNITNTCPVCAEAFNNCKDLQKHVKHHEMYKYSPHTERKDFCCEYCGKKFAFKSLLLQHIISHTQIANYECEICGRKFTRIGQLNIHRRTHTAVQPYTCDVCSEKFTSPAAFRRHESKHKEVAEFCCRLCGCDFKYKQDCRNHIRRKHLESRVYKCVPCAKTVTSVSSVRRHLISIHEEKENQDTVKNLIVTRLIADSNQRWTDVTVIKGTNGERWRFDIKEESVLENKQDIVESYIINKLLMAEDEKVILDKFAHKKDFNKSQANSRPTNARVLVRLPAKHVMQNLDKNVHLQINEITEVAASSLVICPNCNLLFANTESLLKHQVTCTKNVKTSECLQDSLREDIFECEFCSEQFANNDLYSEHMLLVEGEKLHVCAECNIYFTTLQAHNSHILEYHQDTDDVPFPVEKTTEISHEDDGYTLTSDVNVLQSEIVPEQKSNLSLLDDDILEPDKHVQDIILSTNESALVESMNFEEDLIIDVKSNSDLNLTGFHETDSQLLDEAVCTGENLAIENNIAEEGVDVTIQDGYGELVPTDEPTDDYSSSMGHAHQTVLTPAETQVNTESSTNPEISSYSLDNTCANTASLQINTDDILRTMVTEPSKETTALASEGVQNNKPTKSNESEAVIVNVNCTVINEPNCSQLSRIKSQEIDSETAGDLGKAKQGKGITRSVLQRLKRKAREDATLIQVDIDDVVNLENTATCMKPDMATAQVNTKIDASMIQICIVNDTSQPKTPPPRGDTKYDQDYSELDINNCPTGDVDMTILAADVTRQETRDMGAVESPIEDRVNETIDPLVSTVDGDDSTKSMCGSEACDQLTANLRSIETVPLGYHVNEGVAILTEKNQSGVCYLCTKCKRKFTSRDTLVRHQNSHHVSNNKTKQQEKFECAECEITFSQRFKLTQHLNHIHVSQKPTKKHYPAKHVCKTCGKAFAHKSQLGQHAVIHTGEKKHTCSFCPKSFRRLGDLNVHVRLHTRQSPHVCDRCAETFPQRNDLLRHLAKHAGSRDYQCDVCAKDFAINADLVKHKREVHGRHGNDPDDAPFQCRTCRKTFWYKSSCQRHEERCR